MVTTAAGGTGGGSGTTSGGSAAGQLCPQLRAAEAASASAPTGSSSDPAAQKTRIDNAIKVYKAIGSGAPANVQKATSDMVDALTTLETVYSDPTHPDATTLTQIAPRISSDSQVISAYIAANCH